MNVLRKYSERQAELNHKTKHNLLGAIQNYLHFHL